jgi:hypothetical protein
VLYAYNFGLINKPNWDEFAALFDESGFEVYVTRALVKVGEAEHMIESRAFRAKQVQTRFFKLAEYSDSLDPDEQARLLSR